MVLVKYPSHARFPDGNKRVAVCAVVLDVLNRVYAEGARAEAGKGAQEKAAG